MRRYRKSLSARAKRRHPTERGTGLTRWAVQVLAGLTDNRVWRRHPYDFAVTRRAKLRRNTRHFVITNKTGWIP